MAGERLRELSLSIPCSGALIVAFLLAAPAARARTARPPLRHLRPVHRLSQQHGRRKRRDVVDRPYLACIPDGSVRQGPLLAGGSAPRDRGSSATAGPRSRTPARSATCRCFGHRPWPTAGPASSFAISKAASRRKSRRSAADGVSCTVCHQISEENLGEHASFDGGYVIDAFPAGPGQGLRTVRGVRRPPTGHAFRIGARTGRRGAHPALRAVRHLPHAVHARDGRRRRDHRRVRRAGALSRVETQRLPRDKRAARTATCRRWRCLSRSLRFSVSRERTCLGTSSAAATSSC